MNNLSKILVGILGIFLLITFSSCVTKKSAVKDKPKIIEDEQKQKELALKLFKEGAELLLNNNQEALEKFEAALGLDPELIPAYYNAGLAQELVGNLESAQKHYENCLVKNNKEGNCLESLFIIMARRGQGDQAQVMSEQYVKDYPEDVFARVAAAKLALAQRNLVLAEKYAREVLERDAESVGALSTMARVFYENKEYYAARWVAKNALEQNPAHGGLYLILGHTFIKLDQLADALDAYGSAAKYLPTQESLESYGLLLLRRGRVKESLGVLERLANIRSNNFRNWVNLGNSHMANKNYDEAKESYERALSINPEELDIYYNLGILHVDLKPKSVSELQRMKLAKDYFEAFLKKPNISKSRLKEVKNYLSDLNEKIEYEEEAAREEAEMEAAEPESDLPESEPEEEPVQEDLETQEEPKAPEPAKEPEIQEELEEIVEEEEPKKEKKKEKKKEEKREDKKEEEDLFDEEEEDFFDEF